jgi:hypothetical protein
LAILFKQSQGATQMRGSRLALVLRHALRMELEPQMWRACFLFFLLKPDHHIRRYWLRDTFELNVAALLTSYFILYLSVCLK